MSALQKFLPQTAHQELAQEKAKVRHLRAVKTRPAGSKKRNPLFLALVGIFGVLVIFAVQLGLNLTVSSGAYEINDLLGEQRDLSRAQRVLQLEVESLESPQNLATRAAELSMVQNLQPALLKLDGAQLVGSVHQSNEAPRSNAIGNSALELVRLPDQAVLSDDVVRAATTADAGAQLGDASVQQAGQVQQNTTSDPVPWEGKLTAPTTR